jgi:hypothetical protein
VNESYAGKLQKLVMLSAKPTQYCPKAEVKHSQAGRIHHLPFILGLLYPLESSPQKQFRSSQL